MHTVRYIASRLCGEGTSAPELVVSLDAALTGNPGLATGNIVGSNIANVLLIVGAAALLAPMAKRKSKLYRDGALLLICSALFVMLCWGGELDLPKGALLVIIFAVFIGSAYWRDINDPGASAERVVRVAPRVAGRRPQVGQSEACVAVSREPAKLVHGCFAHSRSY